jgi:Tfp pilus assembly protein PilZ
MYICTETPPPVGTHIELVFSFGDLQGVEMAAIVVWINNVGPAGEKGMGVQFLSPPSKQLKENIVKVVDRFAILEKNATVLS